MCVFSFWYINSFPQHSLSTNVLAQGIVSYLYTSVVLGAKKILFTNQKSFLTYTLYSLPLDRFTSVYQRASFHCSFCYIWIYCFLSCKSHLDAIRLSYISEILSSPSPPPLSPLTNVFIGLQVSLLLSFYS